jgi:hypothetical protein
MWPFIPFVCLHPLSCIKQANLHTLAPQQDNHSYRFDSQSTKDALRLARQWLSSCMKDHPECRNEHDAIPSRLIFIGDGVPRLLLSTEISGTPRYATLSHCWGKEEHQTLKRDTMKVFQECIPVEALPKTFKDAIYAAIELGLEYIWIDSLCIVQDDIDDWKMESVKMSSVYGNSTISLAASKQRMEATECSQTDVLGRTTEQSFQSKEATLCGLIALRKSFISKGFLLCHSYDEPGSFKSVY